MRTSIQAKKYDTLYDTTLHTTDKCHNFTKFCWYLSFFHFSISGNLFAKWSSHELHVFACGHTRLSQWTTNCRIFIEYVIRSKAEWNFLVLLINRFGGLDLGKKSLKTVIECWWKIFIVLRYCDILFKYRYSYLDKKYRDSQVHRCIVAALQRNYV